MIAIICPRNGVGLEREGAMLHQLLPNSIWYDGRKVDPRYRSHPKSIHCEVLRQGYLTRGGKHYFYPDPEWFDMSWVRFKPRIYQVLAKTHHACRMFKDWNVKYVGCTSPDRYLPDVTKTPTLACFTGHSQYKNAKLLVETWNTYRDLPPLYLYSASYDYRPYITSPNIIYHYGYLDDNTLQHLQNQHQYHLCISNAEGFGHYINEAMSCNATILTMDGDPMRELTSDFTVKPTSVKRLNMGEYYTTNVENIYLGVMNMLNSQPSNGNRERYIERHQNFVSTIRSILA